MNIRNFVAILSQNPHYDFLKMRGGSKAVRNFAEKSSVLVLRGIPYAVDYVQHVPKYFIKVKLYRWQSPNILSEISRAFVGRVNMAKF